VNIGDIADELGRWRVGGEVSTRQVRQVAGVAGDGRHRPPRTRLAGHEAQATHDSADGLLVDHDTVPVQPCVDAPIPVGSVGLLESESHLGLQDFSTPRGC
jgi:hypothetical protein